MRDWIKSLVCYDLGTVLSCTLSFLLKHPKTSSEIPILLLVLPWSFFFWSLDSSKGISSISSSLSESLAGEFLVSEINEDDTDEIGEPLEGVSNRISRSLFDNIVDHRFNPGVDVGSEVVLDFFFLFRHGLNLIFYAICSKTIFSIYLCLINILCSLIIYCLSKKQRFNNDFEEIVGKNWHYKVEHLFGLLNYK